MVNLESSINFIWMKFQTQSSPTMNLSNSKIVSFGPRSLTEVKLQFF